MASFILDWAFFIVGIALIGGSRKISHRGGRIAAIVVGVICIVVSTLIMFNRWGWF